MRTRGEPPMTDDTTPPTIPVLVVGGGTAGVTVVERLLRDHDDVVFLDADREAVETAAALGATVRIVDVTDGRSLERALPDAVAVELAIVVSDRDATALLVGQLAKTKLGTGAVIALMHDPRSRVAFEDAGMVPVCATTALADAAAATCTLVALWDREPSSRPSVDAGTAGPPGPSRPV